MTDDERREIFSIATRTQQLVDELRNDQQYADGYREIRALLRDIPPEAPTTIDLDPLLNVDYLVIGEIALRARATRVVFESPYGWLAAEYVEQLSDILTGLGQ